MATFTSKASGNWSASGQTTWNEAGVPGAGDTVTIGAHTVTVDVNTTVGTSPNDTTTKVLDKNSATGTLIIGTGVTLTVRGNIGGINGSSYQLNAGASLVFDASLSGGTPVYRFVNVGFMNLLANGTSGSRCAINAVSGQTFILAQNYTQLQLDYTDVTRCAAGAVAANSANIAIRNCTFTSCGAMTLSSTGTTTTNTITDNVWSSTTGSSGSLNIGYSGTKTSGTRTLKRNVFDAFVTHNSIGIEIEDNAFCGGITCVAGRTWTTFRRNFVVSDGLLNGGNGQLLTGNVSRCYFVVANATGNPHFIAPTALLGSDTYVSQCVFESQAPDLVDTGDAVLCNGANCSSTKVVVENCVVLPSGYSGSSVHSGQLLTVYAASTANNTSNQTQVVRNTCNQNKTTLGGVGQRAAIAFAESSVGFADQVSALKSNIAWAATASDGYLAERISGTVDGIITASGANYNWLHNIATDNNGRGYRDRANSPAQDLWSSGNADGGDAAAAGVDNNQGTGNPQFVDSTRNVAAWATARGYGSTYASGVTAIKADPTRADNLLSYVLAGFSPTGTTLRNAAHDGGCVGSSNFSDTTRTYSQSNSVASSLASTYGVA